MKLYDVYSLFDVAPQYGIGSFIYDEHDTEYLDFYGGHAVISVGHSHPYYVEKISAQLKNLGFYSNSVVNPLQQELALKLSIESNVNDMDLFLINSGAEANDNALKLASFHNKRKHTLALSNSFHGRTSAAINVTHTGQKHQAPINHGINEAYCDFNDEIRIIEEINSKKYASIIIECIQGVGGLDMIDSMTLQKIRQACNDTNTILIVDEVQCGYARSGDFFAYQTSGIQPDIITMAKGMGNGFPIGGVLINAKKLPAVKSQLGTTYGGNHLACAAGIAVLDIIKNEQLKENAAHMGKILFDELASFPFVKKIKGRGLMLGLEFEFPVKDLRKSLVFDHHLFTGSSANPNLLRILPPLNVSSAEVELFLTKLASAIKTI